ncbi:RluA family pseudouridine synthase [Blattabacterium cuenoti]|uniref:RluA family pseudouridine synthase n=1 Tax=Blattabacterium cuenoti TaxID=1653831 RepID=UPI00163B9115|nr:RluA family pseudouridine synthase [Blattabacterium cuenoti]
MEKDIKKIQIIVNEHLDKPMRIDKFLSLKIQNMTRNQIQKYSKIQNILVNDNPVKNNYKVKFLDCIKFQFYIHSLKNTYLDYNNISEEKIKIKIVYEDKYVLVIDKPAGIVVHPGVGNEKGTLIQGIKYHCHYDLGNMYRGGIVHRLDKNTSGLLVFAKNKFSQEYLLHQFQNKTIQREYVALVWGILKKKKGEITGFIGRNSKNRKKMSLFREKSNNHKKYSITKYQILERFKYLTFVSCQLKTGRTHQIRVHFKYIGHPVFQDPVYGGVKTYMIKKLSNKYVLLFNDCMKILKRQALHAISLSFIHPFNGKCHFFSPIPKDFQKILEKCRGTEHVL